MKNDILHSGKLYKFEREHIYQIHLNKINEISKKRTSHLNLNNDKFLPTYPSSYKMEQQLKVKEQNDRLVKKLNQISNRKKCQILMSEEDFRNNVNKYIQLQKNYREKYRHLREKSLQQQNQKIVQKLLDKRKNQRSKEDFRRDQDDFFMLKKSRSKKKSPKRQQTSMGSQQKSRIKKNHSLVGKLVKKQPLKHQTQRKRNYSTLLPTIQKMEGSKIGNQTLDHAELLGLLKKYDRNGGNGQTAREKETQLMNSLDNYQKVFQAEPIIKTEGTQKVKEIPPIEPKQKIQQTKGSQPTNPSNKQNPQQASMISKINRDLISYSEPLKEHETLEQENPMDPKLKFQKIKRKKKNKKRQLIGQVKEQNQYEDEAFQVDNDQ